MTDSCFSTGLVPFEQALKRMLVEIIPLTSTELVSLNNSINRVVAENICSPVNVPPTDNSAMDGYAFAASHTSDVPLNVVGKSMAGAPFQGTCKAGECVRIMTGAVIPDGCDTVVMQEQCLLTDEKVLLQTSVKPNKNVRHAGEDVTQGDCVFTIGRRLSTIDIGVLASLGIDTVKVYKPVKVALFSTGDELKHPGETLSTGDIYESNSYYLRAMLEKFGVEVISMGIIADDKEKISQAFIDADQSADVVITTGGVSVGEADYTKQILESLGQINFWKVAIKPGKPFAFGKLPNSYFFGLPGNPVSALVTAHQLVMPAIAALQNLVLPKPIYLTAKTMSSLRKVPGRMDFQRGIMQTDETGQLVVSSTGNQGSGVLTSMAMANCYIVLPQEEGHIEADKFVTILPFDQYLQ
ncbi:molybdopterin molybdotransferase MoeA [Thalassotalea sediminis]|uniref:molybdopterin molybdotransferase MoeA n=1 Tax=Thalassotalea sediminis TaxID=1759089 RepID=UPI00257456AE|nr:molybdopterin molybdotransferase MoeA [Thalassotalea sediminis]